MGGQQVVRVHGRSRKERSFALLRRFLFYNVVVLCAYCFFFCVSAKWFVHRYLKTVGGCKTLLYGIQLRIYIYIFVISFFFLI